MNHSKFVPRIQTLLKAEPYRTFKAKEIARRLGVRQDQYHLLRASLREMVREGLVFKYPRNRYGKGRGAQEAVGVLHVKTQGYGFVTREDGEDVFISQKNMGLALHKDKVRVRLFAHTRGKSVEGKIIEVLERARQNIVGTYRRGRKYGFVVPDELKIQRDIYVHDAEALGARPGQKVVAQIVDWEHEGLNPEGRIVEILGFPDELGVDVLAVARAFDLPDEFSHEALQEAHKLADRIPQAELSRRLDLRGETVFTIDPPDAKDFDDAVSLEQMENGNLKLGVHIADVSWFVGEDGAVDQEAKRRGTSVYLVDRVIPMLPERISNHLCSLKEEQERLCLSVLMELVPSGELAGYEFRESVIQSAKRFDYETVQAILDGSREAPLAPILKQMFNLSKALIRKRQRRGSIDLDAPEVQVLLDNMGKPVEIRPRRRLASHRLIEEFMLLANETVARHVGVLLREQNEDALELPFVYRIHEKPNRDKLTEFLEFLSAFGIQVHLPGRLTPRFFQRIIEQVAGLDAAPIIRDAMLRAMMKARYSTENAGHFGLAYKHYTHFTSPIRRYPDLMVHRLLKRYALDSASAVRPTNREALEATCRLASETEVVAQEAERESVKLKQVEYMARRIGERYEGVISRVVPFGVFVELTDLLVEGLVHVTDLGNDYFIHDEAKHAMIGQHHGRIFRVGDKLAVRVARVDVNQHIVDFVPTQTPEPRRRQKTRRRRH